MSAPHGLPPARPMQANSHLRGLSASSNRPSGPPPPVGKAPVSGRSSRAGAAGGGGGDGGISPRVTTPRGNAAALAAASSVLGAPAAPSAPPPVPRNDGERMQHQQGQQQQGSNSSGGGQQGPPPPPSASFEGGRAAAMSGKPELTGGPHRGKEKRQYIFRNKYLDDARDSARRLQLLDLVKMLSASNIRQADEIDALRRKQQELEKRLEQFAPLEGLLHFMEDSEDPRLVSMLAPAPRQPGRGKAIRTGGTGGGVTFSGDGRMSMSDYGAAAAAAHPPETQATARLVSEKVLALMRLCGDGEGVEDEELLREVREVESAMMGVRVQDHRARMTGGGADGQQQQQTQQQQQQQQYGDWHVGFGGEDGRESDAPPGTPSQPPSSRQSTAHGRPGDDSWGGRYAEEDPFAAEIAAVGTSVRMMCKVCGTMYIEATNHDAACRFHPGQKRIDPNWNSKWTCCGGGIAAKGCRLGVHVPDKSEDDDDDDPDATPAVQ